MPNRAIFLTPIFEPYAGGAAVHFEQLSRHLVADGVLDSFVVISAFSPDSSVYESRNDGRIFRVLFSPKSLHRGFSKSKVIMNYLLAALCCLLAIIVYRATVVHTHTRAYFSLAVRLAKILETDVLIDGRDLGSPDFPATGDVFIACAENIARKARRRKEQVVSIPVGIDPAELTVNCDDVSTPSEPYMLFVGDITERKGVPELLEGYRMADCDHPLLLIGEAVEADVDFGADERVHYLGPKPHSEVLCYIRNADLVLLPSKEEGLPRVVLEAIFHQTLVLCPPVVPEFREHIPELTLSSVDAENIHGRIDMILDDGEITREFPITNHYLSNVMNEYASVYQSLREKPGR